MVLFYHAFERVWTMEEEQPQVEKVDSQSETEQKKQVNRLDFASIHKLCEHVRTVKDHAFASQQEAIDKVEAALGFKVAYSSLVKAYEALGRSAEHVLAPKVASDPLEARVAALEEQVKILESARRVSSVLG